jgi:hypothetical protein
MVGTSYMKIRKCDIVLSVGATIYPLELLSISLISQGSGFGCCRHRRYRNVLENFIAIVLSHTLTALSL